MAVRHAEDAEGADHHVQVDRIDVAREAAAGATALEDPLDQLDRRGVLAREVAPGDVLGAVDVLDAHEPDELRVRLVVVERQLGEPADRGGGLEVVDLDRLLGGFWRIGCGFRILEIQHWRIGNF